MLHLREKNSDIITKYQFIFKGHCRASIPSLTCSQIGSVAAPPLPRCTVDSEEVSPGSLSLLEKNEQHVSHKAPFLQVSEIILNGTCL